MEECTEKEVQRLLPLVSMQRREQALRYKHTFGQYCCLKSWLMLKELIGEFEDWQYNEYGKPYIDGLYFNISHCKAGLAVVADEKPIGIDIETIRHIDQDLIERTMNANEKNDIHSDRDFIRLWTQKEAVVKARGVGIESFEQLQEVLSLLCYDSTTSIKTVEAEKYIYSIAYKN